MYARQKQYMIRDMMIYLKIVSYGYSIEEIAVTTGLKAANIKRILRKVDNDYSNHMQAYAAYTDAKARKNKTGLYSER